MSLDIEGLEVGDLEDAGGKRMALSVEADDAVEWIGTNARHVQRLLEENGALLVRGLRFHGSRKLEKILTMVFGQSLLEYTYRSTPRTRMRGRIFTSSEYHPDEVIHLHNEHAYANTWPMKIGFYCVQAAAVGGATPIADSRLVYDCIPREIREEFSRRRLCYVRNYADIDLPWEEVFQTKDKRVVEQYCEANGLSWEWVGRNGLRTKQNRDATFVHPRTGENLWFNQAHLFHISSLSKDARESLWSIFAREDLPRNVYFSDGGEIDEEMFVPIRQAFEENEVVFDWRDGDLLLLDNMLFAHGRRPYRGERLVLTGMAEEMDVGTIRSKQSDGQAVAFAGGCGTLRPEPSIGPW